MGYSKKVIIVIAIIPKNIVLLPFLGIANRYSREQ